MISDVTKQHKMIISGLPTVTKVKEVNDIFEHENI